MRNHQVDGIRNEAAILRDSVRGPEIEVDAGVDATLSEVAVESAIVSVIVEQLAQSAQVLPQTCRWDR